MVDILKSFNDLLWGLPLILAIAGTGIYISIKTQAIQFRKLGYALKNTLGKIFEKNHGNKKCKLILIFNTKCAIILLLQYRTLKC